MQVVKIIPQGQRRIFNLEQASDLLPVFQRVTEQAEGELRGIVSFLKHGNLPLSRKKELQAKADKIVDRWSAKITRMGAIVKGLWMVDFDMGSGYYSWQLGEEEILFYRNYQQNFSQRSLINQATVN